MSRFWTRGTCSNGSSTPRSPRAAMTASDVATIFSTLSSAVAFSIFATSFVARPQLARRGEIPDPNARPLEVQEDGDRRVAAGGDSAGGVDPLGAQFGSPVGCIDAHDVRAGLDQSSDRRFVARRGTQGRNDL